MVDLRRKYVHGAKRVVVKIGSRVLSSERGLHSRRIGRLVRELAALHDQGKKLVVVSSGAIASGISRLGLAKRPTDLPQEQALAAVGQIRLMALYENSFAGYGKHVGQVLLTHEDLANRKRYLNAKHTLKTLLDWDIIPIVNENDTVAVEEVKFGDNDQLSALVATLMEMDLLVILSDVDGVYDRDPRSSEEARLMPVVTDLAAAKKSAQDTQPSDLGRGGMYSKLCAAEQASQAGIPTVIASGREREVLNGLFEAGRESGTLVLPEENRLTSRKHWILYNLKPSGEVMVDNGACAAVTARGKSLLPSGVREIRGSFGAGECVSCVDDSGREFARGLVNYSSQELHKIKGSHSGKIEAILGYKAYDEIIHRDDLVLL
jgi:glutamate 5-kinase